ncbi:hypothetical protein ACHAPJ_004354 [Fusarium lateritium]
MPSEAMAFESGKMDHQSGVIKGNIHNKVAQRIWGQIHDVRQHLELKGLVTEPRGENDLFYHIPKLEDGHDTSWHFRGVLRDSGYQDVEGLALEVIEKTDCFIEYRIQGNMANPRCPAADSLRLNPGFDPARTHNQIWVTMEIYDRDGEAAGDIGIFHNFRGRDPTIEVYDCYSGRQLHGQFWATYLPRLLWNDAWIRIPGNSTHSVQEYRIFNAGNRKSINTS